MVPYVYRAPRGLFLQAISPASATRLAPSFTMTVTGSGFVSGTTVLWDGSALPTAFVSGEELTTTVTGGLLQNAGVVTLTTRSPAPGNFTSNALHFVINALEPVVTSLSPASVEAGSATIILTVEGSNFAPDAQIIWYTAAYAFAPCCRTLPFGTMFCLTA